MPTEKSMTKVEPINTVPIQQFLQQVKSADLSRAKEIVIKIDQAKTLAFTLGIVMSRLNGDLEKIIADMSKDSNSVIEIKVDGGNIGL